MQRSLQFRVYSHRFGFGSEFGKNAYMHYMLHNYKSQMHTYISGKMAYKVSEIIL